MKNGNKYLIKMVVLLLAVFVIGKLVFIYYNHHIEDVSAIQVVMACISGLPLDLRTAALMMLIPVLCVWLIPKYARWVLIPYFILMGIAAGVIIGADIAMYEFWEFKLSSVVLSYAASPEGTTNSVSIWFIASRIAMILSFVLVIVIPALWMMPRRAEYRHTFWYFILVLFVTCLPIGVKQCYYARPLFLNHAATNSVYRFAVSFLDDHKYTNLNLEKEYDVPQAYKTSNALTDTLLTTDRPNVLIVMMESFGGKFVKELGGIPDVAPNLSRMIPQGIFWDEYYSNSFRTDRGTVCTFSGWNSYPTISPMKSVQTHSQLTSIAKTFRQNGYQTGYMYGGAMTNMGKYRYLCDMEFESLMDDTYFTKEEMNSSWGSNDGTTAMKMFHTIAEIDSTAQWMMAWQTLSSHEPWDVPYHRLEDEKLNAFAYTDQCVSDLVDSLRTLPVWDDLLVIIIPDHGFLYEETYDNSEFFHSPMLWMGGALKEPRLMHTMINQSDIAATLLAQMGISHDEYPWSRNVLAPDYQPFVYCTYPAGFLYKDSTGETLYDLTAGCPIPMDQPVDSLRLQKGLSILKHSYNTLKR